MDRAKNDNGILTPGTVFEKYTVERLLGKGGMGAVYLVRHNILDSLFALKVLFPEVAAKNARFVDRFIREAKLACKIKHPNLIAVHDAGKNLDTGIYYIVMDYVPGGNVRELLKKEKTIPIHRALQIITQIASALEAANQYHMVHRDIKPDNIMFADDGSAKLADLGIAKSADEQDTMLTMAADVFGTPAYMSPEQAKDSSQVDSRADIYSLGIVFYEMISGQRPIHGKGTIQILSQVVSNETIPDIRTVMPEAPEELACLLADMTEKNVEFRIQSPTELLKRLEKISQSAISATMIATKVAAAVPSDYETSVTIEKVENLYTTPHTEMTLESFESCKDPEKVAPPQAAQNTEITLNVPYKSPEKNDAVQHTEITMHTESPLEGQKNLELTVATMAVCSTEETHCPANNTSAPGIAEKISSSILQSITADKKRFLRLLICVCALLLIIILGLAAYSKKNKTVSAVQSTAKHSTTKQSPTKQSPITKVSPKKAPQPEYPAPTPPVRQQTPPSRQQISPSQEILEQAEYDLIETGSAVIVSGTPGSYSDLKKSLRPAKISLLGQAGLGSYNDQIKDIVKAKPTLVILEISQKFAEDDISLATFENAVRFYLSSLRDNTIPFAFCFSAENPEYPKIKKFNDAVQRHCNLYSVPVLKNDKNLSEIQSFIRQYSHSSNTNR